MAEAAASSETTTYPRVPGKSKPMSDWSDEELLKTVFQQSRQLGKSEMNMFSVFMRTALDEVSEYVKLIESAKTQAKRDFYQKKIKKVTKRLQKLLPK